MKEKLFNRFETIKRVRPYVDKHYDWVREYGEKGKPTVWVEGPCPTELWLTADVPFVHSGNYPAMVAASHMQEPFIKEASDAGFSSKICSYCRIMIGLALMVKKGKMNELPASLRLPKPTFLFSFNGCPAFGRTLEVMSEILDIPSFIIDCPYISNAGDYLEYERAMDYVEYQLHKFVSFLENITGKPLDWNLLREHQKNIVEEIEILREIRELAANNRPTPIAFGDWLSIIAIGNILRGQAWVNEYLREVLAEVKKRIAEGIGSIPGEKYRLYWSNVAIWYKTREITEYLARHNTAIVAGNYPFSFCENSWDFGESYRNLDRPLRAIAEEHATRHPMGFEWRLRMMKHYAEPFKVDGLIFHSPQTCRSNGANGLIMLEQVKRDLDIPTVMVQADHTDPSQYSKAQVEDRIESFVETFLEGGGKK